MKGPASMRLLALTASLLLASSAHAGQQAYAPFGWLRIKEERLVLRIQQQGLEAGNRWRAARIVGDILHELTGAGYHVFFEPSYVKAEAKYFRKTSHPPFQKKMDHALAGCLERSLKSNRLDWECLKKLSAEYGDQLSESRWPWSIGSATDFDPKNLHLQSSRQKRIPMLELKTDWSGRSGYRAAIPLGGEGLTVWNLSATLRLKGGRGKVLFERRYTKGEESSSYAGWSDTPAAQIANRIQADVKRGMIPSKAAKPSRRNAASIAGSRWSVKSDNELDHEIEFGPNGKFLYYQDGKTHVGDGWVQDGEIVRFSVNHKYAEYEAELSSMRVMSGFGMNKDGVWKWTATRILE